MLTLELFYGVFWVAAISVVWFNTDAFVHYAQLFGLFENTRMRFSVYLATNKNNYFPDFLANEALKQKNKFAKFIFKLLGCPKCLNFWLSVFIAFLLGNWLLIAPIYILSLVIVYGIFRWL